jgi:hypothetical protein
VRRFALQKQRTFSPLGARRCSLSHDSRPGINAQPITYTHNGKQYVSVLSGIGGLWWNTAREQLKDKVPQGGSVWTFAVID